MLGLDEWERNEPGAASQPGRQPCRCRGRRAWTCLGRWGPGRSGKCWQRGPPWLGRGCGWRWACRAQRNPVWPSMWSQCGRHPQESPGYHLIKRWLWYLWSGMELEADEPQEKLQSHSQLIWELSWMEVNWPACRRAIIQWSVWDSTSKWHLGAKFSVDALVKVDFWSTPTYKNFDFFASCNFIKILGIGICQILSSLDERSNSTLSRLSLGLELQRPSFR